MEFKNIVKVGLGIGMVVVAGVAAKKVVDKYKEEKTVDEGDIDVIESNEVDCETNVLIELNKKTLNKVYISAGVLVIAGFVIGVKVAAGRYNVVLNEERANWLNTILKIEEAIRDGRDDLNAASDKEYEDVTMSLFNKLYDAIDDVI